VIPDDAVLVVGTAESLRSVEAPNFDPGAYYADREQLITQGMSTLVRRGAP
jgi:hypothetical protein